MVSTTVPIEQSATATMLDGSTVTANYNVTDNGSVATIGIAASGSLTANDYSIQEGYYNANTYTTFSFSRPVRYSIYWESTSDGYLEINLTAGSDDLFELVSGYTYGAFIGTIYPSQGPVSLMETWEIGQIFPNSEYMSGSDQLEFTFTAILEPSSAILAIIPAAFLLSCRRLPRVGIGFKRVTPRHSSHRNSAAGDGGAAGPTVQAPWAFRETSSLVELLKQ